MWRTTCGADFGLIETWLQPTPTLSAIYPCPYPEGSCCPRRIVCHGDDEIAAICQDPYRICPDLSLMVKDVLLYDLDLPGFMNPVLQVAGIRNPQMEPRSPGVWNVGLAVGGDLLLQPAYLLVFGGAEEFSNCRALPHVWRRRRLHYPRANQAALDRHAAGASARPESTSFPLTSGSALMTPEDLRQFDSHPRRRI